MAEIFAVMSLCRICSGVGFAVVSLCRICNPTPSNMSICDAKKVKYSIFQLCRICNPTPSNMSICDAEKDKNSVFFGLQILIFIGAGLQIQPNSIQPNSLLPNSLLPNSLLPNSLLLNLLLLNSLLLKHSCSKTPAQFTPAQTLLPIRTAFLGLMRPERGSEQSAQGSALGMRATHTNALNGQKHCYVDNAFAHSLTLQH